HDALPIFKISTASSGGDDVRFGSVRERLRVLSANTPNAAVNEYQRMRRAGELDDAQRYGLAYAPLLAGHGSEAAKELAPLLDQHPGDTWLLLAQAQAKARAGNPSGADAIFEDLVARMPRNRAVTLTYAGVLAERNSQAAGKRAQDVLRPLLASAGDDP